MRNSDYEYITLKTDLAHINARRKTEHIGKNIYVYDLTPLAFLSLRQLKLYKLFGIDEYKKDTKDMVESIIMERTLNIVLSKLSFDYYVNNITAYMEMLEDYIREELNVILSLNYEDENVLNIMREYIYKFFSIMNVILAGSINTNYNLKDIPYDVPIPWTDAFYVTDYCISKTFKTYRLEITRYYYYTKETK